jgi:phosphoribosylamine--glycine ligase
MYLSLAEAGHDVKVFINDKDSRNVLGGLIKTTPDWKSDLGWIRDGGSEAIVISEGTRLGSVQDRLRRDGYNVIGGSAFGDRLENDRLFGQHCMREAGMQTAAMHTFHDFAEAIRFIHGRPRRYVFKMNGNEFASGRNLVGELDSGEDIAAVLEWYAKDWTGGDKPDFVLMDHVDGVETGVGGYFNGERFLDPVVIDWEHKRFFNGDLGELTGEMGTLLSYRGSRPLFEATLQRMKAHLGASGYVGYININTIVNERGVWPLEFTSRFGDPGAAICSSLHEEGWDVLFQRMIGRDRLDFATAGGFAVGVLLTVPPFPQHDFGAEYSKGLPVLFRQPPAADDWHNMHLSDVRKVDGRLVVGDYASLMVVTGRGPTVEAAQADAYRRCANVVVPGIRYRTDIGDRFVRSDRARMQKWGFWRP